MARYYFPNASFWILIISLSQLRSAWAPREPLRRYACNSPPLLTHRVYMCQWIGSTLVQVMACRPFSAKPSYEPMLWIGTLETNVQEFILFFSTWYFCRINCLKTFLCLGPYLSDEFQSYWKNVIRWCHPGGNISPVIWKFMNCGIFWKS